MERTEMIVALNHTQTVISIKYSIVTTDYCTHVEFIEKYLSGELSNI